MYKLETILLAAMYLFWANFQRINLLAAYERVSDEIISRFPSPLPSSQRKGKQLRKKRERKRNRKKRGDRIDILFMQSV